MIFRKKSCLNLQKIYTYNLKNDIYCEGYFKKISENFGKKICDFVK